ncbi:HNH endonuclease [Aeromicrobium sp. Marseille-Q0843]|uniref:HNH endonuclease n=1 Tax=Aeromicrobium phoceense TaxID=2754045 RepID=A0A838XPH0_9ACTN|nr:HNH endonuclease [Aeromicrobium phoceense]
MAYRPPESLRQALRWRDGTCRVAGCRAPAHETDLDHAKAYDSGGTTSGSNLRCLCRKHHNMKSHGHLDDRHLGAPTRHIENYLRAPPFLIELDIVVPRRTG